MEPTATSDAALLTARLLMAHGHEFLELGERFGEKLVDRGSDAIAATAVASLLAWLRARAGKQSKRFDEEVGMAIAAGADGDATALAAVIHRLTEDAVSELEALVSVARAATKLTIVGTIKAANVAESITVHEQRITLE